MGNRYKNHKTFYLYSDNIVLVEQTVVDSEKKELTLIVFDKEHDLGDIVKCIRRIVDGKYSEGRYKTYPNLNETTKKGDGFIISFEENVSYDFGY